MEEIKYSISTILPKLDQQKTEELLKHLDSLGVENKEHLYLLEEKDLISVLKVIPARMLIRKWKDKGYLVSLKRPFTSIKRSSSNEDCSSSGIESSSSSGVENHLLSIIEPYASPTMEVYPSTNIPHSTPIPSAMESYSSSGRRASTYSSPSIPHSSIIPPVMETYSSPCMEAGLLQFTDHNTSTEEELKAALNSLDWASDYAAPWHRLPPDLIHCLMQKKRPNDAQRRYFVRTVAEDIHRKHKKPGKRALTVIARRIVKEYPASFADVLDGEIIGEGHRSLTRQLETKFDNLNRSRQYTPKKVKTNNEQTFPETQILLSDLFSQPETDCIINWQPALPDGETKDTQTFHQEEMKRMSQMPPECLDVEEAKRLAEVAYYSIRVDINNNTLISKLKLEWPLLFLNEIFLRHFEILVGVNLMDKLQESLATKGPRILRFLYSDPSIMRTTMSTDLFEDEVPDRALILMLMMFFEEHDEELFIPINDISSMDDLQDMTLPATPCLVYLGQGVLKAHTFVLIIEGEVVFGQMENFTDALALLFASYFIFNIHYPKEASATLEFIQRCLIGINPSQSLTSEKVKKKEVSAKVLRLMNKISTYECNDM